MPRNDDYLLDYQSMYQITHITKVTIRLLQQVYQDININLFAIRTMLTFQKGVITIHHCSQGTQVAYNNCTPFIKCIKKNDGTMTDHAEDLDLVMLMCNLLEYSPNFSDVQIVYDFIKILRQLILIMALQTVMLLIHS